jgi:hypothetical protein
MFMSLARVIYGIVAAVGGFGITAIVLAIVDLYLTGHGWRALADRRLVDAARFGIHLSVPDGLALAVGGIAGLAAFLLTGRRRSHTTRRRTNV